MKRESRNLIYVGTIYLLTFVAAANLWSGIQTNDLMSKGYNWRKTESIFQKYCMVGSNPVGELFCEAGTFPGRAIVYLSRSLEDYINEITQSLKE